MKHKATITAAAAGRRKPKRQRISLSASGEEPKRAHPTMEEILGLYKPRKKPVTLRLDADVLDWFKKPGHGYQTRINRALRKVMREEKKELGE
ncbi:MAG: BrnA antitoxin family protein [Acidobacteriia bacterium]|nr:BrnA antitoxin family protein [Terriglobia bacterium]